MTTTEHDYIAEDLRSLAFPVANLKLLPGNPRRGDVDAVARSYDRFGQRKPIVARRSDMTVIAGNHQLQAAQRLGWTHVAVVWTDDDDLTAKAYALADNRTADLGSYDEDALGALLTLVSVDEALLASTGYDEKFLSDLLSRANANNRDFSSDPEIIPDNAIAHTTLGDVWILGRHRLVCGDSTDKAQHRVAVNGSQIDLVWTDPPYGVDIQERDASQAKLRGRRKDGKGVLNDDLSGDDLSTFLLLALSNAYEECRPGAAWYVAGPGGDLSVTFGSVLREIGVLRHLLVWVKDAFVMGRADYHYRHEMIYYGWKEGAAHTWNSDRKQDSILEFARPKKSPEHPTMKPLDLIAYCIENSSLPTDHILDPFGGSGSTLMAAHSTGRTAHLIELDPRYCDVICARFQKATGIVPVAESTGREHSFIEE